MWKTPSSYAWCNTTFKNTPIISNSAVIQIKVVSGIWMNDKYSAILLCISPLNIHKVNYSQNCRIAWKKGKDWKNKIKSVWTAKNEKQNHLVLQFYTFDIFLRIVNGRNPDKLIFVLVNHTSIFIFSVDLESISAYSMSWLIFWGIKTAKVRIDPIWNTKGSYNQPSYLSLSFRFCCIM